MAFPVSPVNGQTAVVNNISYIYNSTSRSWTRYNPNTLVTYYGSGSGLLVSNTTPSTSTTTGALQVVGGAGIQGNVFAGNVYTGGLYWSSNGAIIQTGGGGTGITYTAGTAPPASGNNRGDQWYDTATDTLFMYEYDGSTYHWVDISTPVLGANVAPLYYSNANIGPVLSGNTYANANIIPTSNSVYSIGAAGSSLNSVYVTNVYASGYYYANGAPFISSAGMTYTTSTAPPISGNVKGDQWYNTTTDALFEYTYDGSNYFWLDISSPVVGSSGGGGIVSTSGNTTTAYSASNTWQAYANTASTTNVIDSFYSNLYSSAKYQIQFSASSAIQSSEVLLAQDGTTSNISEYVSVYTSTRLGTFSSNITSGTVNVYFTPTTANIKAVISRSAFYNLSSVSVPPDLASGSGSLDLSSASGSLDLMA